MFMGSLVCGLSIQVGGGEKPMEMRCLPLHGCMDTALRIAI